MNLSQEQWETARGQLGNMRSEELLGQARMLKNMDKTTVRRMNPQFAQMSDAQIDMALTQMEVWLLLMFSFARWLIRSLARRVLG